MSDEKKNMAQEELGKRDFLKAMGAGFGVAGLTSFMGGPAFAQADKKGKYLVVITNGANDPNRAILGLLMAQVAIDKGWGKVHVWFTLNGADLANRKRTDSIESPIFKKFGSATKIMNNIKEKGGWFGCCPPCAEFLASTGSDKHDFVEMAGGDWLMKNIQDSWVAWF
jgi:predicted peroxiredoxin